MSRETGAWAVLKVSSVVLLLGVGFVAGCGPSQADLEAEMPSAEEIEISAGDDAAMTDTSIGGDAEVDGSTDTF